MKFKRGANLRKTVAVVIVAALILAAFAVLPQTCVKAQASQVKVLKYSWYVNHLENATLAQNQGDLVVVGEIQNVGSSIIQNVTVSGTAYNSTGQAVASAEGIAYSYETPPGQKVPFFIDFTPASSTTPNSNYMSSVVSIDVSVLSVTDTSTSPYTGLKFPQGVYNVTENGAYTAFGAVVNNGTETMAYVWVVTTFYNASDDVVAVNYTTGVLTTSLAPGATVTFESTPTDNTPALSSEIASYSLLIQSENQPVSTSSPSQTTSTLTFPPSNSPTPAPALPPTWLIITTVGVLIVLVVVVLLFTTLLKKRKREMLAPPPPQPPPPPPP